VEEDYQVVANCQDAESGATGRSLEEKIERPDMARMRGGQQRRLRFAGRRTLLAGYGARRQLALRTNWHKIRTSLNSYQGDKGQKRRQIALLDRSDPGF